jgi:hypothetical protein
MAARRFNETIFPDREVVPQQTRPGLTCHSNQRGSIMLALILNAIYRQFLRPSFPAWQGLGQGDDRDRGSTTCLLQH